MRTPLRLPRPRLSLSPRAFGVLSVLGLSAGLLLIAWVTAHGSALGWHHHRDSIGVVPGDGGHPLRACRHGELRGSNGRCHKPSGLPFAGLVWVIGWLLKVIGIAVVLAMGWFFFTGGTERREREPRDPDAEPFAELPEIADVLADDADAQLAALREGSPRNAIVACWMRLEHAVERSGLAIRIGETSTELTVRALHRYEMDRSSILTLAALYREARFSRHPITEDMRVTAIAALEQLHTDLGIAPAGREAR